MTFFSATRLLSHICMYIYVLPYLTDYYYNIAFHFCKKICMPMPWLYFIEPLLRMLSKSVLAA